MPTGIILLDKPQGLTSNGALQRVRRAYGAASAGHVGTLDPMATGMLPLCLDEATKVIAEIESGAKCYEFTVQLGARTDTGDAEGQVVDQQPIPRLDNARIEGALTGFRGTIQQVPPMYSALKREGRPLYELARQGVEWSARHARSRSAAWNLEWRREHALRQTCECAKGTYIRVLGEDIARALGTLRPSHPAAPDLGRTVSRHAHVDARSSTRKAAEDASGLLEPDVALRGSAAGPGNRRAGGGPAPRAGAGRRVVDPPGGRDGVCGCTVREGVFLGLAEPQPDGRLQPRRLMARKST